MSSLRKSLVSLLAYLGRGAVAVDGLYFLDTARPAAAACGPNGINACTTEKLVERKFRSGYRVLM